MNNPCRALLLLLTGAMFSCSGGPEAGGSQPATQPSHGFDLAQVPSWTRDDLKFHLYGSMGTEFMPEVVLQAFQATYSDLFPGGDLASFGLIAQQPGALPIGLSRARIPHLAGLNSIGINCASCHTVEIRAGQGAAPVRILGATGHFDPEAMLGSMIGATYFTAQPRNMERYLANYMRVTDPKAGPDWGALLNAELARQRKSIEAALTADPGGSAGIEAGGFHPIQAGELRLDRARLKQGLDLGKLAQAHLRLFHNIRASLRIPDQPPTGGPAPSGPGRNDPWATLSAALLGEPTDTPAPVKFGLVWNMHEQTWAHHDGNNRDTIARNIIAALALGGTMTGNRGNLNYPQLKRHTELSQWISPPRYPWPVESVAAQRGRTLYQVGCASCHDGPQTDARLYHVDDVGTDPIRARIFTEKQARLHNEFIGHVEVPGYKNPTQPTWRSTGKYWAPDLAGVWARVPYLHNGSVRTMEQLLTAPSKREKQWRRGTHIYDTKAMGYGDEGAYLFDTARSGNSNAGHDYSTGLTGHEKSDLIEYLKTK